MADTFHLHHDVLVIGGGMAGAWAALAAARQGARVVLVDKGYCGTSGVTATAGPGHWWVPPAQREEAVRQRAEAGAGLADPRWMRRIIETTWTTLPTLAPYYDFPSDALGRPVFRALRGPEYMRSLRRWLEQAGVLILDHHPALHLLRDPEGAVAGAEGLRRPDGRPWRIEAGAVVLASGGCAFRDRLLGADNNTGDGLLMAAEAGAELSGMEFTSFYTVAPVFSNMTRAMSYVFARYLDADGRELEVPAGPAANPVLARALAQGPVWCSLERMPQDLREILHHISPNVMLPFQRRGIDPFKDRFEITLRGEGTVRGIGGLKVESDACETLVPGLFVAGDAASRELVAGAVSGGGNINSAWALSSGCWAGAGAAERARRQRPGASRSVALAPLGNAQELSAPALQRIVHEVRHVVLDPCRNLFREAAQLQQGLQLLDRHWQWLRRQARPEGIAQLPLRETLALVASARWSLLAALTRRESRGMHQRTDAPTSHPDWARRLPVGGLDQTWIECPADLRRRA
ncbi:MAG: FAD-binding protein [Curvibacter sp.]|nr:FAD-binding protein [Curvibacter sp.]